MKVILAENAGFCFGVKRAMKLAFESARNSDLPIYSLGPLIHNPQQVEILSQKGVHEISDLESLKSDDVLIIRSHGTTPSILDFAKAKGLKIVDATCPFVVNAQKLAQELNSEGYQVIIVGEGDHPEVVGIMGFTKNEAWVIDKASTIQNLSKKNRIGVVAQTTQSFENFREVVSALLEKCDELKVFNTICHATTQRQESAIKLAKRVDLMIVIGGHNSANTNRLTSLCKQYITTYHIEIADEIDKSWFDGIEIVGVTAGASTPEWIVDDVIEKLTNINNK
ncbi:MAG: 4-hydroxy-3-methylbut-2-enyl diphosphate reductase [Candidatus Poribacteria bacterium]